MGVFLVGARGFEPERDLVLSASPGSEASRMKI
jgi:hypothetical protein